MVWPNFCELIRVRCYILRLCCLKSKLWPVIKTRISHQHDSTSGGCHRKRRPCRLHSKCTFQDLWSASKLTFLSVLFPANLSHSSDVNWWHCIYTRGTFPVRGIRCMEIPDHYETFCDTASGWYCDLTAPDCFRDLLVVRLKLTLVCSW